MSKVVTMMKTKELVDEYNQLTGKNITRFANREEAESKVMEARKNVGKTEIPKDGPVNSKARKETVASEPVDIQKMFTDLIDAQAEYDCLNAQLTEAKVVFNTLVLQCNTIEDKIQELKSKSLPSALKELGIGVKQTRSTKTRAKKEHLKVDVNGVVYRSVAAAFKELNLPIPDVAKVRKQLKEDGKVTYEGTIFTVVKE